MLKALAMCFNANKIKFIVAVDLGKLDALLQPISRQATSNDIASTTSPLSSSFLDKIFQLKIVLPVKDDKMMQSYVDSVASRFPEQIREFLAQALPHNPRKVKEALNLAFYVSALVDEEEYGSIFPYIMVWSILATSYHHLSSIIHRRPETLFDLSIIASQTEDFSKFIETLEAVGSDESLFFINFKLPKGSIASLARKLCYSHVVHEENLYNYLKALTAGLQLDVNTKKSQVHSITKAINYVGLIS